MLITPLQYLLKEKALPIKTILNETGIHRTTLWRYKVGKENPEPPIADRLIKLFANVSTEINEEPYSLDFNGCYDKTIEVPDD